MLSIQDVLDYCDLDRGEIEAIAEHEHVPIAIAAEMSENLLCSPEGLSSALDDRRKHAACAGSWTSRTRSGSGANLSAPAADASVAHALIPSSTEELPALIRLEAPIRYGRGFFFPQIGQKFRLTAEDAQAATFSTCACFS